jgi:hypothetical protein
MLMAAEMNWAGEQVSFFAHKSCGYAEKITGEESLGSDQGQPSSDVHPTDQKAL